MTLYFDSWLVELSTVFLSLLAAIYVYSFHVYQHWRRKGVLYDEPSFPFGNMGDIAMQRVAVGDGMKDIYDRYDGHKFVGIYQLLKPALLIRDGEVIKSIFEKDFAQFDGEPLFRPLFTVKEARWRDLTPTVTSARMKAMFPTFADCAYELKAHLFQAAKTRQTIEVKEVLAKYAADVVGSCTLGDNKSKPLNNPDLPSLHLFAANIVNACRDALDSVARLHDHATLGSSKEGDVSRGGAMPEVAIFAAGFKASSSTTAFCLYELAVNQEVQERLREEVNEVTADHGGQLTYDAIHKMLYLDRVVSETLRKYPPLPHVARYCVKNYRLPDSGAVLEAGTVVLVPVFAIHRDSRHYPDPEDFDPDRFTAGQKEQRHRFVYLPFGEAGRFCLGERFGLLQAKVAIASLISSYQFNVCQKSTCIPLKIDPKSFMLSAAGGIHLQIAPRNTE